MRVTSETQNQQAILNLQSIYARMAKLQEQISTGKRIKLPSDDPIAAVQILQNTTQNTQLDANLKTIQSASNVLQTSVDALKAAQSVLATARNAALTVGSATNQSAANSALAAQVNSAIDQLITIANRQLPDGTYLFGGISSTTPPFAVTASNSSGQTSAISYLGSQQDAEAIVGQSQTVTTLIAGNRVFQPSIGGATSYSGTTGARHGTGTDTATGQGTLVIQHTLTTFAGTSGIAPGTSTAGDTIIGPSGANSLKINVNADGLTGTVSLNGGTPVAFTNTATDLKVTGPAGEVVSLDTTSVVAGFNGTDAITASGTLSVDGGATTTAIDFGSNQAITNSATNSTTYVDSSVIRQAGHTLLDYPGNSDVFKTLIALRDTINNAQGLSAADRSAALNQQAAELDRINAAIATPLGVQATQAQFLSTLKDRTTSLQLNLQKSTDGLESTDTAAAIVDLQKQQNLYQASLQVTAKLNTLTLADFIR